MIQTSDVVRDVCSHIRDDWLVELSLVSLLLVQIVLVQVDVLPPWGSVIECLEIRSICGVLILPADSANGGVRRLLVVSPRGDIGVSPLNRANSREFNLTSNSGELCRLNNCRRPSYNPEGLILYQEPINPIGSMSVELSNKLR